MEHRTCMECQGPVFAEDAGVCPGCTRELERNPSAVEAAKVVLLTFEEVCSENLELRAAHAIALEGIQELVAERNQLLARVAELEGRELSRLVPMV